MLPMCADHAAASPLGSEEVYLTNTREDNTLAKTAKMLAFPPSSQADRLAVLLKPLAAQPPVSHLTSMALLEAVAAVAVGECCASAGLLRFEYQHSGRWRSLTPRAY